MEEPFSIFPMHGFFHKIYDNSHEIIGWYPNKGKKNVKRGTAVKVDEIDIGTVGGSMLEGGFKIVQGKY